MSSSGAAYQAKLRAEAATAGLCKTCKARKPEPGRKTCEVCIEAAAERKKKAIALAGWCDACLAVGFHRADCPLVRRIEMNAPRGKLEAATGKR